MTLAAKPTGRIALRPTAQVTVKAALQPTAQISIRAALQPTAQITIKTALKPTAQVTVKAALKPTAQVTVKSPGKPAWKPTGKNGTRPKVVMSPQSQGSPLLRNCATIVVLLGTIYFLWGFYKTKESNIARQQSELQLEDDAKSATVKALPVDSRDASTRHSSQNHSENKYDRAFVKSVADANKK